jgi:two-component system, chemotaxis family, response regulator Rcp1
MTSSEPAAAFEILLVEDNPGDVRLTQEALRMGTASVNLNAVSDGIEAMAYLRKQGMFSGATEPQLILLDLNLPRKDGREVLAEIKQDPLLRRIPVVVMTSSSAEQDILNSYDLHANSYVVKPPDFARFSAVLRAIEEFWLGAAILPPKS